MGIIIKDKVWGNIFVDDRYTPILKTKEFTRLKRRTHLGMYPNKKIKYTRYEHSLGVFFLANKLVNIIKAKFLDYIEVSSEDEDAIKIFALCHDIGHGAFSHLTERFLPSSHEENTVRILKDKTSEINSVILTNFGTSTLNKVIDLVEIKDLCKKREIEENKLGLIFIIAKLLSGGIDIDRLDYLARDSYNIYKVKHDFSEILNYMRLDYIDEFLEITFDKKSEYKIANFLNKRFELYDTVYLDDEKYIVEEIFLKYLKETKYELTWESEESDLLELFEKDKFSENKIIKRYANILSKRSLDNKVLLKPFTNKNEKDYFTQKITKLAGNKSKHFITMSSSRASVYTEDNKIYLNDFGIISDISSCRILNSNLTKEKHVVALDIILLKHIIKDDKVIKELLSYFESEIEEERKYIFKNYSEANKKLIIKKLNLLKKKEVENIDEYFENKELERKRITLRHRKTNSIDKWNIKIPLYDNSSITKRLELSFNSEIEAYNYLENILKVNTKGIKQKLVLKTNRESYLLNFKNSVIEVSIDITSVSDEATFEMIECELMEGKTIDLYFMNIIMNEFDFLKSSTLTKKEMASKYIN